LEDAEFLAYLTGYKIVSLEIVSRWCILRKAKPQDDIPRTACEEIQESRMSMSFEGSGLHMITDAAVFSSADAEKNATEA
jgi:hypothetical protein